MILLSNHDKGLFINPMGVFYRYVFISIIALSLLFFGQLNGFNDRLYYAIRTTLEPIYYFNQHLYTFKQNISLHMRKQSKLLNTIKEQRETLLFLQAKQNRFEQILYENNLFRGLLELKQQALFDSQIAKTIHISTSSFNHIIQINKGKIHGIQIGDIAMDEYGIIGQVKSVYLTSAEIVLITDPRHAISVNNDQGDRNYFILKGTGNLNEMLIELQEIPAHLKKNDLLISSGLDAYFPAGYPIGMITDIKNKISKNVIHLKVKPLARLQNLDFIIILSHKKTNESKEAQAPSLILKAES